MKKATLLLLILFCVRNAVGQSIQSSNTYIQTKYHHALHYSVNNSSYLYYDESKQSLYLKIDFSKFKTGNDSLDDWLNDLSGTFFYLKFEIDKQLFQNVVLRIINIKPSNCQRSSLSQRNMANTRCGTQFVLCRKQCARNQYQHQRIRKYSVEFRISHLTKRF
jgi:hypothetical protein